MASNTYQPIAEFYAGKTVFITGGSGFVGKVLIEKLLRSCPDVERIYLLLRSKRGVGIQERSTKLLDSRLFEKVRLENSSLLEKVTPVAGDMCLPELGLSAEDQERLRREVQIFIHSAATVRFDESMKLAIEMNVDGCRKILSLARQIDHLEALVHVSTAYCNCDRKQVDEVVYAPKLLPQKLLDALEWMDEDILDQLTPKLLGDKPNTYTYTKQLAEYLLVDGSDGIPLTIVRPSIVGGSWVEPIPGWVDNFNGPSGLLAAMGKGILRSMRGDSEAVADIVPVDVVVNLLLAAGWYTGTQRPERIPIYNCTTGKLNRFRWGQLERMGQEAMLKNPLENILRLPNPKLTKSRLLHSLKWFFDQQVPCFLLDFWMYVNGKKAIFCNVSNKLTKSVSSLEYFTSHGWDFSNENLMGLLEQMSPADRKEFNFDVRQMNWRQYVENYCLGVKAYALKEDLNNLGRARRRIKILQRISFIFNTVLAVVAWRLAVRRVKVVSTMWYIMLNLVSNIFKKVPRIARS